MRIRHKQNRGVVEVGEEFGRFLIESGVWEPAEEPTRRRSSRQRKEE